MLITCPRCKKQFDPETQFSECRPYGHAPAAVSGQYLSTALFEKPIKHKTPKLFQADLQLLWDERPDHVTAKRRVVRQHMTR